jgi:hypothetical protein
MLLGGFSLLWMFVGVSVGMNTYPEVATRLGLTEIQAVVIGFLAYFLALILIGVYMCKRELRKSGW